jgi:nudix-type nucleoside diphosphatase (YffH/AdpP family)
MPDADRPTDIAERIRVREVRVLSDEHYILHNTVFDYLRSDGTWQTLSRETYDRGNGAAILPYDPNRGTVLLVRQFRYPAYVNGHPEPLVEVIAGLLDGKDPRVVVTHEAEEEAGIHVRSPRQVYDVFMSPGAVTERLSLFVAEYGENDRIHAGGGLHHEGEDIEVLELGFEEAMAMALDGRIADAKTVMLIQHLRLAGLM